MVVEEGVMVGASVAGARVGASVAGARVDAFGALGTHEERKNIPARIMGIVLFDSMVSSS